MITKLCFPTMAVGFGFVPDRQLSPIVAGEDDPQRRAEQYARLDAAVARTCEHLSRAPKQGAATTTTFGERITRAVRNRQTNLRHGRAVTAAADDEESFDEKIKRAVEHRLPRHAAAVATRKNDDDNDENGEKDTENESFGKKLKRAIECKTHGNKTQKQH
jgi:hypothetical protein